MTATDEIRLHVMTVFDEQMRLMSALNLLTNEQRLKITRLTEDYVYKIRSEETK
jgi:hypothetical protein